MVCKTKPASIEEVRRVMKNFRARLNRLNVKARCGDSEAALKVIRVLTEQEIQVQKMGYWLDGQGRPVLRTPELMKKLRKMRTKIDRLQEKARMSQDPADISRFIRQLSIDLENTP